tara:strand:+ start:1282 stop:2316 length:1035 start_codon:yes stop_codon:yes gene_type:complete
VKEIKIKKKKSIIKKLLIKLNRFFGFEIVDQSTYLVESLDKYGYENLSKEGVHSITLPLGKMEIKRPVKSLHIILRSCASVKMLTQNKDRIFSKEKYEYSIRTLNSLVKSLNYSKNIFKNIGIELTIIDHNSETNVIQKYKKILDNQFFKYKIVNLDFEKYKSSIENINEQNKTVTENQKSNMINIKQSLNLGKNSDDLIYFVEDDYLHKDNFIEEMIYTYEKFSTLFKDEIFLCPIDYPYLYMGPEKTNILIGNSYHWRRIDQTLCTFLTSSKMINKYFDQLISMCEKEHYPFEKPLHEIYKKEYCFSPIPSLAAHFTNINSVYGISPNMNLNKLWAESEFNE